MKKICYEDKAHEQVDKARQLLADGLHKKAAQAFSNAAGLFVMVKDFASAVACQNDAGNAYLDGGLVSNAACAFSKAGELAFSSVDAQLWDTGSQSYEDAVQLEEGLMEYSLAAYHASNWADALVKKKRYADAVAAYGSAVAFLLLEGKHPLTARSDLEKMKAAERELQREKTYDVD